MQKLWLRNALFLIISTVSMTLSVFHFGTSIWFTAWIGPIFLMRFIRTNKWWVSALLGFLTLQLSLMIGMIPFGEEIGPSFELSFWDAIVMQAESGLLFLVPVVLIPFLLDKALHRRLPKAASAMIYPLTVVALEYLTALRTGTLNTFGETQYTQQHIALWASLIGIYGISFLVSWAAPVVNMLWEGQWKWRSAGLTGKIFALCLSGLVLFSGIQLAFPMKAKEDVKIAGVIPPSELIETVMETGISVEDLTALPPGEYAKHMNSGKQRLDTLRIRTIEAAEQGAKIIIWPEFSFRLDSAQADRYLEELRSIAIDYQVYLVITYARILDDRERVNKPELNMSVCFTPQGDTGWEYAKTYPNPGLETNIVQAGMGDIPYIDTPFGRMGEIICADALYPHFVRQAADKNIDILLNPSWDGKTFRFKIAYTSGLRAVENGLTMVRVSTGGLSAIIDPQYTQWARHDALVDGDINFYARVPVLSGTTFYGKIGYLFPVFSIAILILLVIWGIIPAKKVKELESA